MGIFGTSQEEEDKLRQAVGGSNKEESSTRESFSTTSSAYVTADEGLSESESVDQATIELPQPTIENRQSQIEQEEQTSIHTVEQVADDENDDVHTIEPVNEKIQTPKVKTTHAPDSHSHNDDTTKNNSSEDDDSIIHQVEEYSPEYDENELNRKYTLERISSHKSIEEAAFEEVADQYPVLEHVVSDHEKIWDVKELDYDDVQDKDNPHNWPAWKKWMVTYTVAFMCLCCSLGSSMYTGGVPEIMIRFGASQELSLAGLTFYLIGLALGPAIAAPLSEVFGRRWIYILSLPIAMLFTMGVGLAKNMGTILVLRFFCGYFASPAMAMGGGTISDIWSKEPAEQSFAIALFCLCPFLGPVLGPVIGGFAGEHKNWQWAASWVLLMFFGFVWPFVILSPETYKPVILKNRAIKRGMKVNAPKINSAFVKRVIFFDLLRPIQLLFKEPIVFFFSVYVSFIFAVLFAFFEAFPVIFRGVYHMDLGVSGLTFISVGIGLILGIAFYVVLDKVYYFPKNPDGTRGKRDENGNIVWDAPETKLLVAQIGSVFLPISLFWLGWTAKPSIHYMAPVAAGIPFGFGLILVFLAVVLYFSMSFPPMNVASAIAANNLLRYLLASVFPLFTVQCYENLGIGWASSLFAFIALAMVPVPFIFSYFGPRLRAKSKYGYAAFFKKLAEEKAAAAAPAEKQEATENVVSDKV